MRTRSIAATLMLVVSINANADTPSSKLAGWVSDGQQKCMFDEGLTEETCTGFHRITQRKVQGGKVDAEYVWMWKSRNGIVVRYSPQIGIVGVSRFTIGELFDARSNLPGHTSDHAVSYSPNDHELVIGVPGEGYQFSMEGHY